MTMRRMIKMTILAFIVFASTAGVLILVVNEVNRINSFMYTPTYFSEGENAYNRGWQSVGNDIGDLKFVTTDECKCTPTLQLRTINIDDSYAVRFDFKHSYFVVTQFSVVLDGGSTSQLTMNVVIIQFNKRVASIPITDFSAGLEYRIEVNNTRLSCQLNNDPASVQPICAGGMDGIILEITGFSGIVQFVNLRGSKLD